RHFSIASFPGMKERTVTINGFSKAYSMTGWRIGYIAGPKRFIKEMTKTHQYTVSCATSFAQYGAEAALRGSQDCVREMKDEYEQRRNLLVEEINKMDGLHLHPPKGTFYAFVNVKGLQKKSEDVARHFLHEANVS